MSQIVDFCTSPCRHSCSFGLTLEPIRDASPSLAVSKIVAESYNLGFRLAFGAEKLNERNLVVGFGVLDRLKKKTPISVANAVLWKASPR